MHRARNRDVVDELLDSDYDAFLSQIDQEESYRRTLRLWIVFALLFSLLAHFLLYWSFEKFELYRHFDYIKQKPPLLLKKNKPQRTKIRSELLSKNLSTIGGASGALDIPRADEQMPLVDETLELIELQQNLPEKEVRLTPSVDTAKNYLNAATNTDQTLESPASAENESNAELFEAALEVESPASSSDLKAQVSEQQLLLEASQVLSNESLPPLSEEEDLLETISANAQSRQAIPEGFSNLDDLLSRSGGLSANTDPVLLPTDLLFAYDQVDVLDGARLSLMKLGILIQKNPDSTFIIEGHSDSFGDENYNYQLSIRRAQAVKDWLVQSLQLDGSRVLTRGRGEEKPLVDPSGTIEAQSLNRRVEIIIVAP